MTELPSKYASADRVVYKYELWPWQQTYKVGPSPIVRHVDEQDGKLCMWVEQGYGAPSELRILVVGTGALLPDNVGDFIGTALLRDDGLVLHVYELRSTNGVDDLFPGTGVMGRTAEMALASATDQVTE